jgi:hypothetical protein
MKLMITKTKLILLLLFSIEIRNKPEYRTTNNSNIFFTI